LDDEFFERLQRMNREDNPEDRRDHKIPPMVALGIERFNQREYFEAHEALESAWRNAFDPNRSIYQGILQIGVGFYHLLRGNKTGAVQVLQRGLETLQDAPDRFYDYDLARLIRETQQLLNIVQRSSDSRLSMVEKESLPTLHRFIRN
jgi:predicted metal-dependent hydrolase